MNLKKLLSAVGLLTVAAPAALSVAACGSPNDSGVSPEQKEAETLRRKINQLNEGGNQIGVTANDQETANKDITDGLNSFKKEGSELILDPTFGEFTAPNKDNPITEYTVTVSIKKGDKELARTKELTFWVHFDKAYFDGITLRDKIEELKDQDLEITANNQVKASQLISDKLNGLNENTGITLDLIFGKFTKPTEGNPTPYKVNVTIKNAIREIAKTEITFQIHFNEKNNLLLI